MSKKPTSKLRPNAFVPLCRLGVGKRLRSLALLAVVLIVMCSPQVLRAQTNLVVGDNASNQTTNFTSGTNTFNMTSIGVNFLDDNNTLNVYNAGTELTNDSDIYVGVSGSGNSLAISNGGTVASFSSTIGFSDTSSNNSVLVTGANSLFTNSS